jgi:L-amino acid N-acyltransferase YncA
MLGNHSQKKSSDVGTLTGETFSVFGFGNSRYHWDCVFPNKQTCNVPEFNEDKLWIAGSNVLEIYGEVGKMKDKKLVLLDHKSPAVAEVVEMLSIEQFSRTMYHPQYINAEKTVNFPLTKEKVTNFSRLDGIQLLGVLDGQGKLCGFACFFVKEWPDFAGDLNSVADRFASHSEKKAYLYLVLVRPEAKGDGAFAAIYDQVEKSAVAAGNVGCAIEIHQLNTQSAIAHKRIGFKDMGTIALHEREDVTGEKFLLIYRQYYRSFSNSTDGAGHGGSAASPL